MKMPNLKKQEQDHGIRLSALERNCAQERKKVRELMKEFEGLKVPLNKAVNTFMPKVDSLLRDRTGRVNSASTVSASVGVSPSAVTSKAKEENKLPVTSSTTRATAASVFEAAEIGDIVTLLSHLKSGTSANHRNAKGFTLLQLAVSGGQEKTVEAILDAGASVNARGPSCKTSLHFAAEKGFINIVKILLVAGADINAKDNEEVTPLLVAQKRGYTDVVKLLIEKGASLDKCSKRNKTALWYAVERGNNDIVKLLCDKGASVTLGKSPLVVASKIGNMEAVILMLQRKNPVNSDQITDALYEAKDEGVVWTFDDARPWIMKTFAAEEALRRATKDGRVHVVKSLLDTGVNVNARGYCNKSALCYAKSNNQIRCVKLLLARGAKE